MARRPLTLLAVFVGVAFVLDAIFFTGFFGSDDASYTWAAHLLAHGKQIDLDNLAHVRLALNVPSAIVYWLADGNIAWIAWAHIGYHLALVVLAYAIGTMLHKRSTGLGAAAIVAVNPLFYLYAGAVLPDNATAVWLALTIVFLELGRRHALGPLRAAGLHYFAAGLTIGVAYSCKETGLIMTVPAAIATIVATKGIRNWKWVRNGAIMAGGLLAFFLFELIMLRITGGEWAFRLNLVSGSSDIYFERMARQGTLPLDRINFALDERLEPHLPLTMWILPLASAAYCFVRRRAISLLTFFWWPTIFMTIGSTSFTTYAPPSIQTRYYAIVILPAAVMLAAVCAQATTWFENWKRRPPRIRSRYLSVALIAIATLVALKELRVNLPYAGNIYSGERARGLALAIATTRDEYPHLPIVLSPFYAERMSPIFFPRAPDDVYADPRISHDRVPQPPFVYLEAADRSNFGGPSKLGVTNVTARIVDIIFAPRRRIDLVRNLWPKLFSVRPQGPYVRHTTGATIVKIIETKTGESRTDELHLLAPLFRLDRQTNVKSGADEHLIISRAKMSSTQFFDATTYKRGPLFRTAQLPTPTKRMVVSVTITSLSGPPAKASVTAYGYAARLLTRQHMTSVIGPTPVEFRIVLESEAEMRRFKLRITTTRSAAKRAVTRIEDLVVRIEPIAAKPPTDAVPAPDAPGPSVPEPTEQPAEPRKPAPGP